MVKIFLVWFLSCVFAGTSWFFAYRAEEENWEFFWAVLTVFSLCPIASAGAVFLEKFSVWNIWTPLGFCVLSVGIIALVYFVLLYIAKKRI